MSDCLEKFFDTWQIEDSQVRLTQLNRTVTQNIHYSDPRTPETLVGIDALNNYLGMFSANAAGWTAKAVKSDTIAEVTRVTVEFSGAGPDGAHIVQLGQYFVEKDGDLVSRLVGFVGIGGK